MFFLAYSIRASVNAIKLGSTPLPVFADASKIESPVLLVNSKISSSLTYLSGIFSSSFFYGLSIELSLAFNDDSVLDLAISTKSYLFAITII